MFDETLALTNRALKKWIRNPATVLPGLFTAAFYLALFGNSFNPTNLMNLVQKNLKSSRMVNAGPHGGKMVCGYNTSNNSVASECVWATTTTFGIVEYFRHGQPAKVTNASTLALKVRDAVEVRAQ